PHEAREDTVLFPAFRKIVSPHEFDSLGEDFEKKEDELFGEDGFEKMVEKVAGNREAIRHLRSRPIYAEDLGYRAPPFSYECTRGDGSRAAFGRQRFLVRRHPEISLSDRTCGRTLCQNWYSYSGNNGPVCGRMRNSLWRASDNWIA